MDGADQQVRRREHSADECHKRRKDGERDDNDGGQGEGPDEDEHPRENDGGGDPFDHIVHDFTNTSPSSSPSMVSTRSPSPEGGADRMLNSFA